MALAALLAGAACGRPAAPVPVPVPALVPLPRALTRCTGSFPITPATRIAAASPAAVSIGAALARWLGLSSANVGGASPAAITLVLEADASRDPAVEPPPREEQSYTLDVAPDAAIVRARGAAGLFYGAQDLAQLAGSRPVHPASPPPLPRSVPCVHVDDAPRFPFRGMHLDVARHFFDRSLVERYVDLLAFYKVDVLHWHLTDDQGFRLRIAGLATEPSYTDEDVREIVSFARDRFVTVVPEIEMPGHARAVLAARPDLSCTGARLPVPKTWGVFEDILCAGNPEALALIDAIFAGVTTLFPSRVVHVGGDEVPTTRWEACPKCAARMKREALAPAKLEGAFLRDVGALLARRGRRAAVWDEALDTGLPEDAIVYAWRSEAAGRAAADAGHDVVVIPQQWLYFDRRQSRSSPEPGPYPVVSWSQLLAFDPAGATPSPRVLGSEGALWTEYVETPADVEMRLLPRLAALAETQWSPLPHDAAAFASRFAAQRPMLDAAGVRMFVEPPDTPPKKVFVDTLVLPLVGSPLFPDGVVRFTLDGHDPSPASPPSHGEVRVTESVDLAARLFLPDGRVSAVARTRLEKQTLSDALAVDPSSLVVGVAYAYYEGDFHALPDFASLTPARVGRMPAIGFDAGFRAERFAVRYDGLLPIADPGVHRCTASADDGVRVTIDGRLVLEDDGEHAPREVSGEVALAAGLHALRVAYFQGARGKSLTVSCDGAGPLLARP
jgi:hexosaminidase